jgi:hypothetical protein
MTAAMVKDLPKSIELLIKGARALQHSPAGGADWSKGKVKGVQNKVKGKRKKKCQETVNDQNSQQQQPPLNITASVNDAVLTLENRVENITESIENKS